MEWRTGAMSGRIVADGNGQGRQNNQLNSPLNVIVDQETDSFLICDCGNKRIVRWPRQNGKNGETVIFKEVKRWKIGDPNGIVVAGGNAKGDCLQQLYYPTFIFVDQDQSVCVSDNHNHRVMQWKKGANEGSLILGGKFGDGEGQLHYPTSISFDGQHNLYLVDRHNHRIQKFNISN